MPHLRIREATSNKIFESTIRGRTVPRLLIVLSIA